MKDLKCEICDQTFINQISLDKHYNTIKHKTNQKIKDLIEENIKLTEQKNVISNELALTYEEIESTKLELTTQKYDYQTLSKKIDITLRRLDEISNMIKWDIDCLQTKNDKMLTMLISNNKEINKKNSIFNYKTLLISSISLCIPVVFSTIYKHN